MPGNKKIALPIAIILKNLARRSFRVFLVLFFLLALVAGIVLSNFENKEVATDSEPGNIKELFDNKRVKEYEEVFNVMKQRQADNDAAASTTYPEIFRELTEE